MDTVVFNWKMNGDKALSKDLARYLNECDEYRLVVCPPYPYLETIGLLIENERCFVGAQDVSSHKSGAYTGEVSAAMLRDVGVSYAIVGHSERRKYHREENSEIVQKIKRLFEQGITPIFCLGESLEEREGGGYLKFLMQQMEEVLDEVRDAHRRIFIAYEPCWAIGTGKVAGTEDIREVLKFFSGIVKKLELGDRVDFLYGGSVNGSNVRDIAKIEDLRGILVGGASLKKEELSKILLA